MLRSLFDTDLFIIKFHLLTRIIVYIRFGKDVLSLSLSWPFLIDINAEDSSVSCVLNILDFNIFILFLRFIILLHRQLNFENLIMNHKLSDSFILPVVLRSYILRLDELLYFIKLSERLKCYFDRFGPLLVLVK